MQWTIAYATIDLLVHYAIVVVYRLWDDNGGEKMKCSVCSKGGCLLFPQKEGNNPVSWLCPDCMNVKTEKFVFTHPNEDGIENSYVMKWKLRDDNGNEWIEEHREMTLVDFEIVYGNNINEIIWFTLRKKNEALI